MFEVKHYELFPRKTKQKQNINQNNFVVHTNELIQKVFPDSTAFLHPSHVSVLCSRKS